MKGEHSCMLRGMKAKPINPRWLAFVDELMVDGNATRADIAAGNRPKDEQNAAVSASKLIRNPKVAALIAERRAVIAAKSGWTVDRIVARSGEIAMQDKPDRPQDAPAAATNLRRQRPAVLVGVSSHPSAPPPRARWLRRRRSSLAAQS